MRLCELKNAPEIQKCPKVFVHDYKMTGMTGETRVALIRVGNPDLDFEIVISDFAVSHKI